MILLFYMYQCENNTKKLTHGIQLTLNYTVVEVGCTFCLHEDFQSGQTSSLFKKDVLLKDVNNGSLFS